MKTNPLGIALIKHFEGCRLQAYRCPAGIWTVGYGHTGADVHDGLLITETQAEEILKRDLERFETGVTELTKKVKNPLDSNQFSALVCFAFNCGLDALRGSTLLHFLLMGTDPSLEFGKWCKAKGNVIPGLVKRREAERNLFNSAPNLF